MGRTPAGTVTQVVSTLSLALLVWPAFGYPGDPAAGAREAAFVPTEDRSLAQGDMAKGDFVVKGKSVPLRHAYVRLESDSHEPARPPHLRIVLTDVPVDSLGAFDLLHKVEENGLHYIEVKVDQEGHIFGSQLCHPDFGQGCISQVTLGEPNIRFEPKAFAGHRIAGRLHTARPDTAGGVSYSFSADFQATLWEITGRHLGAKPDGSFGVAKNLALGSFTVDGQAFTFGHAYARATPAGTEVLLTEKPLPAAALAEAESLFEALVNSEGQGLAFTVGADGVGDWQWRHARLAIGCGSCRELRFAAAQTPGGAIAGTVYSHTPQKWDAQHYEFKATFHASVLPSTRK